MQTVMDLPDELLSQVEAAAGAAGQTTQTFVIDALSDKLARAKPKHNGTEQPTWLQLAGVWKDYAEDLRIVEAEIEAAFEQVEEDMWR